LMFTPNMNHGLPQPLKIFGDPNKGRDPQFENRCVIQLTHPI